MLNILSLSTLDYTHDRFKELSLTRGCKYTNVLFEGVDKENKNLETLDLEPYDIVITDESLSLKTHIKLAERIWKHKARSLYCVLATSSPNRPLIRHLEEFGTRILLPESFNADLARYMEELLPESLYNMQRIMIIDPVETPLRILQDMLNQLNFTCFTTSSGKQAYEELVRNPFNYFLVISEVLTDDILGNQLIKLLRSSKDLKNTPAIILSAHGTAKILWDCIVEGASGFLVKPPRRQLLISEVARAYKIANEQLDPRMVAKEDCTQLLEIMQKKGFKL
jgi:CheY-like chemotaxis protein